MTLQDLGMALPLGLAVMRLRQEGQQLRKGAPGARPSRGCGLEQAYSASLCQLLLEPPCTGLS